ncbi:hypothetical protein INH39_13620 [Massilia violaceinigra]|uniref:Uncharacterized protein n=1 Tax=Massilia violaceinigra TaxID=2045208 RepID=A0ABY4AEL6_9BURK|nr:hypothetical protein [Massilia violaceinigra]UOD32595.1 hypothetical protein INH39_13620 [Massilia violaceinigra]
MKRLIGMTLRFVFWYLAASALATGLSLLIAPPNSFFPLSFTLSFFPIMPWLWISDLLDGRYHISGALSLALFALTFGLAAWRTLRKPAGPLP